MSKTNLDHPGFASQLMETLRQNVEGVVLLPSFPPPTHQEIQEEVSGCVRLGG